MPAFILFLLFVRNMSKFSALQLPYDRHSPYQETGVASVRVSSLEIGHLSQRHVSLDQLGSFSHADEVYVGVSNILHASRTLKSVAEVWTVVAFGCGENDKQKMIDALGVVVLGLPALKRIDIMFPEHLPSSCDVAHSDMKAALMTSRTIVPEGD